MPITNSLETAPFVQRYGPWAVVAGASEGLGAEYARQLAQRGLNLILVARHIERLQALAADVSREFGVEVRVLVVDLARADAADLILTGTSRLDIGLLVYNAAFSAVGPFLERSIEDHLKEVDTNIRAPLVLAHAFGKRLVERKRGGMILMSSLSAMQGTAYVANYAATKAYNALLGEGLWDEWKAAGVDVLVCVPSAVRTPNYLASRPTPGKMFSPAAAEPRRVVEAALKALGRQPSVIPGAGNRLASFVMRFLMPRTAAIRMMGSVMRSMYGHKT
jgi:uncharacterized protein